jgi:hypothetical protein
VKAKELRAQGASARKKGSERKSKVPNQRSTRGFKGDRPDSSSSVSGSPCQQNLHPLTCASQRNSCTQPRHLDSRNVQTCRD